MHNASLTTSAGWKVAPSDLSEEQQNFLSDYFDKILYPVLTPLAVDRSRPFPMLTNKSLNLAVRLKGEEESLFAVVQDRKSVV